MHELVLILELTDIIFDCSILNLISLSLTDLHAAILPPTRSALEKGELSEEVILETICG